MTTDIVVITAAIVGLGVAVGATVGSGGVGLAEDTAAIVETHSSDAGGGSATAKTRKEERAEKKAERKKKREARKKRRDERKAKRQAKPRTISAAEPLSHP